MRKNLLLSAFLFCNLFTTNAQSWTKVGTGANALNANGSISSICADNAGNIYAAGTFGDSNYYNYVAKWDGTTWSKLGTVANAIKLKSISGISSICVDPFENVYALIDEDSISIYKWDGTSWSEFLVPGTAINDAMCTDKFGNFYTWRYVNDSTVVIKWNGTSWEKLGNTLQTITNGIYGGLCTDTKGNIYASGHFNNMNGNYYVAKWDGSTWTALFSDTNNLLSNPDGISICTDLKDNLYLIGNNLLDKSNLTYVAKWNGSYWSELGSFNIYNPNSSIGIDAPLNTFCVDTMENVYTTSNITDMYGNYYVTEWNGEEWNEIPPTSSINAIYSLFTAPIATLCSDRTGNIYAGGVFNEGGIYNVYEYSPLAILTGVASITNTSTIAAYPNPTTGSLTINSPEGGQVVVYNALGEAIVTQAVAVGNSTISLEKAATGIYTILLTGQTNSYAPVKVVKN